jgi:hypothetical protein
VFDPASEAVSQSVPGQESNWRMQPRVASRDLCGQPILSFVEERLSGVNTHDGVVGAGSTVRRPTGPWTPGVHALLSHLEEAGCFSGAPPCARCGRTRSRGTRLRRGRGRPQRARDRGGRQAIHAAASSGIGAGCVSSSAAQPLSRSRSRCSAAPPPRRPKSRFASRR